MSETRSIVDNKPIEELHIELMKLRRYYAGKAKERGIQRKMFENSDEKFGQNIYVPSHTAKLEYIRLFECLCGVKFWSGKAS